MLRGLALSVLVVMFSAQALKRWLHLAVSTNNCCHAIRLDWQIVLVSAGTRAQCLLQQFPCLGDKFRDFEWFNEIGSAVFLQEGPLVAGFEAV